MKNAWRCAGGRATAWVLVAAWVGFGALGCATSTRKGRIRESPGIATVGLAETRQYLYVPGLANGGREKRSDGQGSGAKSWAKEEKKLQRGAEDACLDLEKGAHTIGRRFLEELTQDVTRWPETRATYPDGFPIFESSGRDWVHTDCRKDIKFYLGVIEFDENGEAIRDQVDGVLDKIRDVASRHGVELIVYAHGWRHNADACNNNLRLFRTLLQSRAIASLDPDTGARGQKKALQESGRPLASLEPRPVFGVYLGWRGRKFEEDGWGAKLREWRAFYDRKKIAERIGTLGAREVVSELAELVTQLHEEQRSKPDDAERRVIRSVLAGHSLGGAVLFTAVEGLFRGITEGDGHAKVPFDSLFLVNPAIESRRFDPFHEKNNEKNVAGATSDEELPAPPMTVIASKADGAMRWAFPFGMFWKRILGFRWPTNGYVIGLGQLSTHQTHDVLRVTDGWKEKPREGRGKERYRVFLADKQLIPGHGEIFSPEFVKYLRDLVKETANTQRASTSKDGAKAHAGLCPREPASEDGQGTWRTRAQGVSPSSPSLALASRLAVQ